MTVAGFDEQGSKLIRVLGSSSLRTSFAYNLGDLFKDAAHVLYVVLASKMERSKEIPDCVPFSDGQIRLVGHLGSDTRMKGVLKERIDADER